MLINKIYIYLLIIFLLIFTGCSSKNDENGNPIEITKPVSEKLVINNSKQVYSKLYKLELFAYGNFLNCKYPKEEVGSICCIKSKKHSSMCVEEYDIFEKKLLNSNEFTETNLNYPINNITINFPENYLIIKDSYFGGELREYMLYYRFNSTKRYQIQVSSHKNSYNFSFEDYSNYLYRNSKEDGRVADISSLISINKNSSYFDYTLIGDYKKRQGLVLKGDFFYYIIYSGSDDEFIEELNIIINSFNK